MLWVRIEKLKLKRNIVQEVAIRILIARISLMRSGKHARHLQDRVSEWCNKRLGKVYKAKRYSDLVTKFDDKRLTC